jgi:hypothetical protein
MKRFLIISGLLISLVNMLSHGALSASYLPSSRGPNAALRVIGHCHGDGEGVGYFHPHPISKHGSLCVHGQLLESESTKVIHHGRTGLNADCLQSTILPIPTERDSAPVFWSYLPPRDAHWHLGVSSGGIPS